jgi:hypothetical protein
MSAPVLLLATLFAQQAPPAPHPPPADKVLGSVDVQDLAEAIGNVLSRRLNEQTERLERLIQRNTPPAPDAPDQTKPGRTEKRLDFVRDRDGHTWMKDLRGKWYRVIDPEAADVVPRAATSSPLRSIPQRPVRIRRAVLVDEPEIPDASPDSPVPYTAPAPASACYSGGVQSYGYPTTTYAAVPAVAYAPSPCYTPPVAYSLPPPTPYALPPATPYALPGNYGYSGGSCYSGGAGSYGYPGSYSYGAEPSLSYLGGYSGYNGYGYGNGYRSSLAYSGYSSLPARGLSTAFSLNLPRLGISSSFSLDRPLQRFFGGGGGFGRSYSSSFASEFSAGSICGPGGCGGLLSGFF